MPDDELTKTVTANDQPTESSSISNQTLASSSATADKSTTDPKNRKKWGLLALVVAALALLGGGGAAAYYGVIVPNKPENVLKTAVTNTPKQTKSKFDGKLTYESTDPEADVKAVNVSFNGSSDIEANAFQSAFEITASGVKVPFELRKVDKSLYFKIGDLSGVKSLAQSAAPTYGPLIETLSQKVANQWIEVDETLLKQAQADCALNTSFVLTDEDYKLLQKRYKEVPFTNIKSTTNDTVNGRAAIKYEIEIDDNKGAEYLKGLDELSVIKKLKECNKELSNNSSLDTLADNDITPLTLWVDKANKQIVKFASHSTKQDEEKEKFKANLEVTLQYGEASISKPEGSMPFMQVFGDLRSLFNNTMSQTLPTGDIVPNQLPTTDPYNIEGISPECLKEIQDYANSGGTKPVPACINN